MKKLLALLMVFALVFAFAGCGSDVESDIKAYIEANQEQFDAVAEANSNDQYGVSFEARDASFVFVFKLKTQLKGADLDTFKTGIEAAFSTIEGVYDNVLAGLQENVPEAESVIIEYQNADGSVIIAQEIK